MSYESVKDIIDTLYEEILMKGPNYWKDKDPKKYRAMLNKLKNERKKPGSKERGYQQVLQAKRRERGGSGTKSGQNGKSGHSSGRMKSDTATAVKRYTSKEKKHGKKMSMDRKNNNKGYGDGNVRLISQKYNKGDEKYSKKAPELKKFKESPYAEYIGTLIKTRAAELNKEDLFDIIDQLFGLNNSNESIK